jgi:hypothetical protein
VTTIEDFSRAIEAVKTVLAENEPKHQGRWRRETVYSHVAHAAAHLQVWQVERSTEDLEHALVRLMMAVELARGAEKGDRP